MRAFVSGRPQGILGRWTAWISCSPGLHERSRPTRRSSERPRPANNFFASRRSCLPGCDCGRRISTGRIEQSEICSRDATLVNCTQSLMNCAPDTRLAQRSPASSSCRSQTSRLQIWQLLRAAPWRHCDRISRSTKTEFEVLIDRRSRRAVQSLLRDPAQCARARERDRTSPSRWRPRAGSRPRRSARRATGRPQPGRAEL
jgi:hypothetical protein